MKINEDGIDRDATAAELASINDLKTELETKATELEDIRMSARNKLAALGLTDDEINAIIGGV